MSHKKNITIILILTFLILIIFIIFYFLKQGPEQKAQEQITPPAPAQKSQSDIQREELKQLRDKYKVDNNSPEQLKRQYEALEKLKN